MKHVLVLRMLRYPDLVAYSSRLATTRTNDSSPAPAPAAAHARQVLFGREEKLSSNVITIGFFAMRCIHSELFS